MGGGTPTTLPAPLMARLLNALETHFDLSSLAEYTVEAGRPDTVTAEKLAVLKAYGVSRVSINPQTMEDRVLQAIGRRHTAADVLRAMDIAQKSGIPHINMDLIAGLPEDTAAGFRRSLDSCIALAPANITVHTLALKKGARILLDGLAVPPAEAVREMLDYAEERLTAAGYAPYYLYRQKYMSGNFENVGWSLPGPRGSTIFISWRSCTPSCPWAPAAPQRWWTPAGDTSSGTSTVNSPRNTWKSRKSSAPTGSISKHSWAA